MIRFMLAILVATFTVASAAAQAPGTCANKAVGKDGRELHGAARTSFMAKCKREVCAPKAVGSNGKPLRGAAKKSFMDKCLREQA
jgi:hypothetical protein